MLATGILPLLTAISAVGVAYAAPSATSAYDYIVVGAGTAGAVVAARLAEDKGVTVLLLEAGDDKVNQNLFSFVPGADVIGVGWKPSDTVSFDWNFVTVPQSGAANRAMHYARGKGVGGTSNRNFMLFHRPTRDSFQFWTNATQGDSPGWSWEDVYPYYTKSAVQAAPDNAKRGAQYTPKYNPAAYPEKDERKAPLPISFSNFVFEYDRTLQQALNELQYPNASDFSSGTLNGVQYSPSSIQRNNSHRSTSQKFIDNAKAIGLTNLNLQINAQAARVNFDSDKNAVSVTYRQNGKETTATARKEIIISAGVFQSPQLLMNSGIGPAATLQQYNIPVVVDLPGVGKNFQDHVFFTPGYEIDPNIYQFGHESNLLQILINGGAGIITNSGSLTNPVSDFLGWQKLNESFISAHSELDVYNSYPPLWPHIEFLGAGGLVGDFSNLLTLNAIPAAIRKYYYSLEAVIIVPQSRGTVTLASKDPYALPSIDPAFLTSPADQIIAVEMYRKVRRIFNTTAFRSVRANKEEYFPGYKVDSDADILKTIQSSVQTLWHGACTCSMQPRDNNGVLDSYLRVYGVQKLRVVDASSFPSLLPGHPQSTVYMLGERAADLIKKANGGKITTVKRTPPSGDAGTPYTGPN